MGRRTTTCPKCQAKMVQDLSWRPPEGIDGAMRLFVCTGFACDEEVFILLTPKQLVLGMNNQASLLD